MSLNVLASLKTFDDKIAFLDQEIVRLQDRLEQEGPDPQVAATLVIAKRKRAWYAARRTQRLPTFK